MAVAAVAVTVAATTTSSATTGKIDVMSVCVCDAEKDQENVKKIGKDCRPERERERERERETHKSQRLPSSFTELSCIVAGKWKQMWRPPTPRTTARALFLRGLCLARKRLVSESGIPNASAATL